MSERARYLAIGCGSCEYEEADGSLVHYCAKCSSEIYQFLTQAALADRLEQEELSYARQLAIGMHAHHYADVTEWRPLPDLIGLLTQISNMAAGLALRPEPAQPVAQDSVPMWPIARVLSRDGKIVEAEYYSPSLPDDVWHDLYPTSPSHPALSAAGAERQAERNANGNE